MLKCPDFTFNSDRIGILLCMKCKQWCENLYETHLF
jgi:hypothetical protein